MRVKIYAVSNEEEKFEQVFENVKLVHVLESTILVVKENWDSEVLKLFKGSFVINVEHTNTR